MLGSSSLVEVIGSVFVAAGRGVILGQDTGQSFGGIAGRSGTEVILATVCRNAGFPSETLSQDRKVGLGRFGGVEFFFSPSMTLPSVPSHSNVRVL